MCIGNLSAEPENHNEIVKLGEIESLIILLRTEVIMSGRYASFALVIYQLIPPIELKSYQQMVYMC